MGGCARAASRRRKAIIQRGSEQADRDHHHGHADGGGLSCWQEGGYEQATLAAGAGVSEAASVGSFP